MGTQVSSTNKTDCHDTTEILLPVALNTRKPTFSSCFQIYVFMLFHENSEMLFSG
jgi:hypothetical protein